MKRKLITYLVFAALLVVPVSGAYAAGGANVNACVYLPTEPLQPIVFKFIPRSLACMDEEGNSVSFTVATAGVVCQKIGYVESGNCQFGSKDWDLGYSSATPDGEPLLYTGDVQTTWSGGWTSDNEIDLKNSSSVFICNTAQNCKNTKINWDSGTEANVYIIFQLQSN